MITTGKLQKRATTDEFTSIQVTMDVNGNPETSCLFVSNSPIWPYSSAEGNDIHYEDAWHHCNMWFFLKIQLIDISFPS